ncbi:MAG: glycoside hydrolase family 32 protein [Lachnospiraceae bacterium]|nr:glycoside hydrolase family 32 protein [Lachnospiraceae bacterium]
MIYTMDLNAAYLGLPVKTGRESSVLEIYAEGEKRYELAVPELCGEDCDYYCWLRLSDCAGKRIALKGDLNESFFEQIRQTDQVEYEPITRPLLHFTAERGWINDPNGMVYHNGVFHLFFQYNPADTKWGNMSWGHAVSTDFLNFLQTDTVLLPDEHGAVYSGSGIVNEHGMSEFPENALVFFYTAAGGETPWSEGRAFTQRIAVSTDGGRTLKKLPREAVGVTGRDSRDPQVFWHDASKGYIMALWIQGEEIALLRSENLQDWEMTDRFSLPGAFECPNLICLQAQEKKQWVLVVADGSYYFGEFDGYRFASDGVRRSTYLTALPYAAQAAFVEDPPEAERAVLIPWLRTRNSGKLYTGAMGLPRELGLVRRNGTFLLQMRPVREYGETRQKLASCEVKNGRIRRTGAAPDEGFFLETDGGITLEIKREAVTELVFEPTEGQATVDFFGQTVSVERDAILFGEERTALPEAFSRLHILIDRQIIEVYGNDYTRTAYYETGADELTGFIRVTGCMGELEVYQWKQRYETAGSES